MIEELLFVAQKQGLTGREAFRKQSVHWLIELDENGVMTGLTPTVAAKSSDTKDKKQGSGRGKKYDTPCTYHMQIKTSEKENKKGEKKIQKQISAVKANAPSWVPDFLTAPAWELFPSLIEHITNQDSRNKKKPMTQGKPAKSKGEKFVELLKEAGDDEDLREHKGLQAIVRFMESPDADKQFLMHLEKQDSSISDVTTRTTKKKTIADEVAEKNEVASFTVNDKIIFNDKKLKDWWAKRIEAQCAEVASLSPKGTDFYQNGEGSLSEFFPKVFGTIQFASFDSVTFQSYGLGKQTTSLRVETAEQAAAGLNWLTSKNNGCTMSFGDLIAVYWAKVEDKVKPANFVQLLSVPDPLEVKKFLRGVHAGINREIETGNFYLALFKKGNQGRFSVRSWHTETLSKVEKRFENFLATIELVREMRLQKPLSLAQLASATIAKTKKGSKTKPAPETYKSLFETAMFESRVPEKILTLALARQRAELTAGDESDFETRLAARIALVMLYFRFTRNYTINNDGGKLAVMKPNNQPLERDSAYLCGRLLAMLDAIHRAAHKSSGGTRSSPANRVYSSASKTPGLIFPRLCEMARVHLDKIAGNGQEGNGLAFYFEYGRAESAGKDARDGLATIVAALGEAVPSGFPSMFNLEEQGRFAIGFYSERAIHFAPGGKDKPPQPDDDAATDDDPQDDSITNDSQEDE